MTYELAKQLKDAGFSQQGKGYFEKHFVSIKPEKYLPTTKFKPLAEGPETEDIYIPTLSELIEACGESFDYLEQNTKAVWTATNGNYVFGTATTPEEAVAKLLLALNAKEESNN